MGTSVKTYNFLMLWTISSVHHNKIWMITLKNPQRKSKPKTSILRIPQTPFISLFLTREINLENLKPHIKNLKVHSNRLFSSKFQFRQPMYLTLQTTIIIVRLIVVKENKTLACSLYLWFKDLVLSLSHKEEII